MCSGATVGLAGRAGLDLSQLVVIGNENSDNKSEYDSARPKQEGRAGND